MTSVKLNLGCGKYPKEGYLNLDLDPRSKADKVVDLSKIPYDLPSNHFELVEADHVLARDEFDRHQVLQ